MAGRSRTTAGSGRARLRAGAAAVALVASAAGVAYAAIGLAAPEEPMDPDYLWQPWPPLDENAPPIGILSTVVFACALGVFASAARSGLVTRCRIAQVAVLVAFAMWLGAGYQIVTAGVTGANIGGGGVLLLTPLVALLTILLVGGLALTDRRSSGS